MDAGVACRQAGYQYVSAVLDTAALTAGTIPSTIWMDEIQCKGTESHLSLCPFDDWGLSDCSTSENVGVECTNSVIAEGTVRLYPGPVFGRVDIYHNKTWGKEV